MKNITPGRIIFIIFVFFWLGGVGIFNIIGGSVFSNSCTSSAPSPEYGWKISSMDISAQILDNGEMKVREKIIADFETPKHGIYRTIPLLFEPKGEGYKTDNFSAINIQNLNVLQDGQNAKYEDSERSSSYCPLGGIIASEYNKEKFIKIGDAEKTITGRHEYVISYIVKNALRDDRGYPEIYWNMVGQGWGVDIDSVNIRITRDGKLQFASDKIYCYSGLYGSQDEASCQTFIVDEGTIDFRVYNLRPYHGVTIQSAIKEANAGAMSENTTGKQNRNQQYILGKWYYLLAFVPFLYFLYIWNKNGKDPVSRGIIAPRYDAPDNLSPSQTGVILDQSVDNVDIAATIISIAQKGWMKITYNKGGILGLGKDYTFTKSDGMGTSPLTEEEQIIYSGIFSSSLTETISQIIGDSLKNKSTSFTSNWGSSSSSFKMNFNVGKTKITGLDTIPGITELIEKKIKDPNDSSTKESVNLSSLKNVFYPIVDAAKNRLYGWAVENKYLKTTPGPIQGIFFPGYILLGFFWYLAIVNQSFIMSAVIFLSTFLSFVILFFYRFYTAKGKALQEEILGLKMYMSTAEKDRIEFHNAPARSPELFQKLLPYAMALGVTKIWADKFSDLHMQPPSWYVGPYTASNFNAAVFANDLTNASSSFASTMTSVPSRSGSGGGGGGFSGGGGGGGGGGSW